MKRTGIAAVLLLLASASCDNAKSKLDKTVQNVPSAGTGGQGAAPPPSAVADHSGDVETRLRRLEDNYARYAEALDFLQKVYDQNKQQQKAQEAQEPDPTAVFAVNIADNVKLGMVEGPVAAPITIVEAWDFA